MDKLEIFNRINAGETFGSVDKNLLQEAYADSDKFWELTSKLLSQYEVVLGLQANLLHHCLEVSDSLLDQALEEFRKSEEDAYWAGVADDQN